MKKYLKIFLKYALMVLIILVILAAILIGFKILKNIFGFYVTAQFTELSPRHKDMPVYFKGFKVGMTGKTRPDSEYKYIFMKLKLSLGRRKLPDNITAKIKKFKDESEYIDLIYPEIPSTSLLKRGSVIEGKTAEDIASFIDKQADSDALKKASENIGKISDNTAKLTDQLNQILTKINNGFEQQQVSNIVSNIEKTSENIKYTTESIKNITVNIDKATKNLDESLDKNLGQIFENIKNITENVDKATKNLDKTFIKIDSTISGVNEVIYNSAVISKGFKNTLEKRFGGARIIFGTPISSKEAKINKKGNSIPPVQSTQPVPASKTIDADNIPKSTPSGCPISPRP